MKIQETKAGKFLSGHRLRSKNPCRAQFGSRQGFRLARAERSEPLAPQVLGLTSWPRHAQVRRLFVWGVVATRDETFARQPRFSRSRNCLRLLACRKRQQTGHQDRYDGKLLSGGGNCFIFSTIVITLLVIQSAIIFLF